MNIRILALAFLLVCGIGQAADVTITTQDSDGSITRTEVDVDRTAADAAAVGRHYARKGERIADRAVDFAEDVADSFEEAFD